MSIQILQMGNVPLLNTSCFTEITDIRQIDSDKPYVIMTRNPYHCEDKDSAMAELKLITQWLEDARGAYMDIALWYPLQIREIWNGLTFRYEDCLINLSHVQDMLLWFDHRLKIDEQALKYADKFSFVTEQDAMKYWGYV